MDLLSPVQKQRFRTRIDELVGGLPNLPAAFEILPQLLTLLDDPEADCRDLAEIIRIDPSLTAAVLRVSNSARYRGGDRSDCLSEGIGRLGLHEVYRVVLAIVTAPTLKGPDAEVLGRVDLWRHSLATAVASQVLAEHVNKEHPEVVFSVGLLHDIGKTILVRAAREQYVRLLERCADENQSLESAEREFLGTDHAEVAGWLLRGWKFPERIAAAVAGHHRPETAGKENRTLAALVCLGNIIAYRLGVANGYPPYVAEPDRDALLMVGLRPENLGDYDEEILERLQREQERL
ncbi:MAG TPA: HDOD domain-containing protein [Verrucomicrobiae bacterium]|jgi:putative nucleotidyltransferase with HDIG domain